MKTIELTQGKVAIVDDHNYEWLNQFKWCALLNNNRWYAARNGGSGTQSMHRLIMGNPVGMEIDHKDRSPEGGLDNREENLRVANSVQNGCNRGMQKNNTSGYKGVSRHKVARKWQVMINGAGKQLYLGLFNTAVEAAAVYNFAAKRLHGEFAVLNDLSNTTEEMLCH